MPQSNFSEGDLVNHVRFVYGDWGLHNRLTILRKGLFLRLSEGHIGEEGADTMFHYAVVAFGNQTEIISLRNLRKIE